MHRHGDRNVPADQFQRLMPGTRLIEQGGNDRGDVGAGNRATRHGGGASLTRPVAGASVRPPGRRMIQSRARERRSSSAAVFAVM